MAKSCKFKMFGLVGGWEEEDIDVSSKRLIRPRQG